MLKLPDRVQHGQAGALAVALQGQVSGQADGVVVDAQQLVEFDSSALAVLLACRRKAEAAGKAFEVTNAPAKLVQLAVLYGVAQLLGLKEAAALA